MTTTHTWILIVAFSALIIAVDIYLALDSTKANTYSAVIRRLGNVWPFTRLMLTFGLGVIVGHLYW